MHEEFAYYSPYSDMFKLSPQDIQPFNVQLAGMAYCDENYIIYRPNSPIYCFEYIIEGKGYLTQDGTSFVAKKGDTYILWKNATHYYYSDGKDPWTKIYFCVYGELAEKAIEAYGLKHEYLIENADILDLFVEFNEIAKQSKTWEEMNERCCLVFLKVLQRLRKHVKEQSVKQNPAIRLKSEIDNIVDYRSEKSNFDSIIERVGCSKAHAIRLFKAEFKITPYQYMLEKKIALAKMMLLNSFLTVSEIADKLDFCDTHHFSATFKRLTGYAPLHYRKANRHRFPPADNET